MKTITEVFEVKNDKASLETRASSDCKPYMKLWTEGGSLCVNLSTAQMRWLAASLIEIANKIENDKDFKNE